MHSRSPLWVVKRASSIASSPHPQSLASSIASSLSPVASSEQLEARRRRGGVIRARRREKGRRKRRGWPRALIPRPVLGRSLAAAGRILAGWSASGQGGARRRPRSQQASGGGPPRTCTRPPRAQWEAAWPPRRASKLVVSRSRAETTPWGPSSIRLLPRPRCPRFGASTSPGRAVGPSGPHPVAARGAARPRDGGARGGVRRQARASRAGQEQSRAGLRPASERAGGELRASERRAGRADELRPAGKGALVKGADSCSSDGLDVFVHVGTYTPPVFAESGARLVVAGREGMPPPPSTPHGSGFERIWKG